MARRYESVATIFKRPSSMVMSTPVRMARLSSFDTTRATRRTIEANWANGMSTRWVTSTCGKAGKSSGLSALMENEAVSQVMTAFSSSASTCTAASGRFFTMSANSLPGTTARPGCSTRAATVYWTDSSRSVVCNVRESLSASKSTPERMGSVERVATPLSTTLKAFWSSDWLMLNFKAFPFSHLCACAVPSSMANIMSRCAAIINSPAYFADRFRPPAAHPPRFFSLKVFL